MTAADRAPLKQHLNFKNGKTSPDRSASGALPVFGSNGEIGRCDVSNSPGPSIVIGRVGSFCGSLFYSPDDAWVTDNAIICTSREPADTRYWYYALQTLDLNGRSSGSGQPLLNQGVLGSIAYQVPSLDKRLAIAEVLGALDDKIAANTTLLEQADRVQHMTFRSMLADSGPVPLSETARFVNGKAFTKGASGTGRVVIRIAELNSGLGESTVYSDEEVSADYLAGPGDILFAWSGSLTLHRWFRSPGIINQHIFKVMPNDPYPHWLVYELIREKLDEFKAIAANKATTMGHIQRRHLDEEVRVPKEEVSKTQSGLMESLWSLALNAEQENLALATTRDALLPQLMSGKLRVKDAADIVGSLV